MNECNAAVEFFLLDIADALAAKTDLSFKMVIIMHQHIHKGTLSTSAVSDDRIFFARFKSYA